MRIIGIDPSLTATGIATIDTNHPDHITCKTIQTKPYGKTIYDRINRIKHIRRHITEAIYTTNAECIVIEAPSYGSQGAGTWERAGLWWLAVNAVIDQDWGILVEVPPATRARYATGRGNAAKDVVMISAVRRYPHAPIEDNNQADAVILAAIGARLTGHPIDDLPKANLAGGYATLATNFNLGQATA